MRIKLFCLLILIASVCSLAKAESAQIVKRFHLYNQRGQIGPVTIYTPKVGHGGMFKVSTFMVISAGNSSDGSFCGWVGFTSKFGSSSVPATSNTCVYTYYRGDAMSGVMPVPDEGGNPITLQVFPSGETTGAKYDVTIIVEKF